MDITQSFQWNNATVTVRRARVRDRLAVDAVQFKLTDKGTDTPTIMAVREFGRVLAQSTVTGDVGFSLPPTTAPADVLEAAYQQWLDADAELMNVWQKTLRAVDSSLLEVSSEKKQTTSDASQ